MRTFGACGEGANAPRAPPLVTGLLEVLVTKLGINRSVMYQEEVKIGINRSVFL